MKKFTAFILACIAALSLVAAGCRDNDTPEIPETQDKNVTIRIEGDGGCFRKISFTVEKGTVLNAAAYENVMRINNGGKTVYFLGEWHTEGGEKFDFSAPVNESVTISPEKTQVYFEEDNYPYIVMSANEALKENPAIMAEIEALVRANADKLLAAGKKPVKGGITPVSAPAAPTIAPAKGGDEDLDIMVED